jgi:type VI secretion system protein
MSIRSNLGALALTALLQLALSGCLSKVRCTIAINVSSQLNANSPIAFDLVEVNDKDLAKQLAQSTAADWFQKRDQIKRDFPAEHSLSVKEWEWVPGQVVPDIKLKMSHAPRLLIAFANYGTPGPHRAKIDPKKSVLIRLDRDDFELSPLKGDKK